MACSECRYRGQSAVDDVIVVARYVPASPSSGVRGRGTALHCSGVTSSCSRALFSTIRCSRRRQGAALHCSGVTSSCSRVLFSTIREVFILRRGDDYKERMKGCVQRD